MSRNLTEVHGRRPRKSCLQNFTQMEPQNTSCAYTFPLDRLPRSIQRCLYTSQMLRQVQNLDLVGLMKTDGNWLSSLAKASRQKKIAKALGRSYSAITIQASNMGVKLPDRRKTFSADELKVLIQMRDEGASYRTIAAALGRDYHNGYGEIYHRYRPLDDRDLKSRQIPGAQLSLDELKNIDSLRAQCIPWPSIESQYPEHTLNWNREQHKQWAGVDLSPAQLREIERLRHQERRSWQYIADTGDFTSRSETGIKLAYERSLAKEQSQN